MKGACGRGTDFPISVFLYIRQLIRPSVFLKPSHRNKRVELHFVLGNDLPKMVNLINVTKFS